MTASSLAAQMSCCASGRTSAQFMTAYHMEGCAGFRSRPTKSMPTRTQETTVASFRCRSQGMGEAVRAGIAATACSVLILAIVFLAIYALPVSIG